MRRQHLPSFAEEGAARLRAWMLAPAASAAKAEASARNFLETIPGYLGAEFIVSEIAPEAVRDLARAGDADRAAALLDALASVQPRPGALQLRFSHPRQLEELRNDLTSYANP